MDQGVACRGSVEPLQEGGGFCRQRGGGVFFSQHVVRLSGLFAAWSVVNRRANDRTGRPRDLCITKWGQSKGCGEQASRPALIFYPPQASFHPPNFGVLVHRLRSQIPLKRALSHSSSVASGNSFVRLTTYRLFRTDWMATAMGFHPNLSYP